MKVKRLPFQGSASLSRNTIHSWWLSRSRDVSTLVMGMAYLLLFVNLLFLNSAFAQPPPVLRSLFPAGGQVGTTVEVAVSGTNLEGLKELRVSGDYIRSERLESGQFRLVISADAPLGMHDLWAVGDHGISAPRPFVIGNRLELQEQRAELEPTMPEPTMPELREVPLDVTVHGRIERAGAIDQYRFLASKGQRVVVDCLAERIDSRLRAVLEIHDASGRRLAVSRAYFGTDPLIDFRVPADGSYVVRIQDLALSGSPEHVYRLDLDTGPRVAFTVPSVIERGKASRVTLYGWNLDGPSPPPLSSTDPSADFANGFRTISGEPGEDFDRLEVEIPASLAEPSWPLFSRLPAAQAVLVETMFPFQLPGAHAPVVMGVTDVPVVLAGADNHGPSAAREITVPSEVSGQLVEGDQSAWFAISARRGEVLFIEGYGQRIQSPVDLQISLLDSTGQHELALFGDELRNFGGSFPTNHLDPVGRWVCPEDGRYLIVVRNLIGGLRSDPRRIYRLSVRREEPDFQILAVTPGGDAAALNVPRGGRQTLELLAFRGRGCDGPIRVSAEDPPAGVECPDVWFGPGSERATFVVSADSHSVTGWKELRLVGEMFDSSVSNLNARVETGEPPPSSVSRKVRGGTVVRSEVPVAGGRITSEIPFMVAGDAPLRITADGHQPLNHHLYGQLPAMHSPGGMVDVSVQIERRDPDHAAPVRLIGVGLPPTMENPTAVIPADQDRGYISFYLPPSLPAGPYSLAIQAETTVLTKTQELKTVTVVSNPVTLDVQTPLFFVAIDPFSVTRARRGDVIQLAYSCRRLNGFIGKMHTELASPGIITDVPGLLARGVTFVGQTEKGTLQIVVNEDAPLGPQPFLRLFTVGVVEDEPIRYGSSLLSLEIVE